MGEIAIRRVRADEAETFWALRIRGLREHPRAFAASADEDERLPRAEIERRLARADAAVLGAYDDDVLVGIIGVYREERAKRMHHAHIWGFYAAPEARGRGAGAALVEAALEAARGFGGVERVHLTVGVDADGARRIYERAGFVVYASEEHGLFVDGAYVDEHLMVRRL